MTRSFKVLGMARIDPGSTASKSEALPTACVIRAGRTPEIMAKIMMGDNRT